MEITRRGFLGAVATALVAKPVAALVKAPSPDYEVLEKAYLSTIIDERTRHLITPAMYDNYFKKDPLIYTLKPGARVSRGFNPNFQHRRRRR